MEAVSGEGARSGDHRSGAPLVLVVEDDDDIREMVTEVLTQDGYRVTAAPNGADALEQALLRRPDAIVLDLMMPVMTGWQFMRVKRWYPALAGVPVVVVSASTYAPPEDAAAFLQKPFDIDTLRATVARVSLARVSLGRAGTPDGLSP
jgi:CheY-like chemotaxis protein